MKATKTGWRENLPLWEEPFPHGSFFFLRRKLMPEFFMTGERLNIFIRAAFHSGAGFGFYLEALAERFHERINRIVDG